MIPTYAPIVRYIVISGNVVDGLLFDGPFVTHDEAAEYAKNKFRISEWTVATIEGPL